MNTLKYTKELIEEKIKDCYSVAELIRRFGLKPSGGNYRLFNMKIHLYQIDTSHFTGQIWNKGKTADTCESLRRGVENNLNSQSDDEILVENSRCHDRRRLKQAMMRRGREYICDNGHYPEWMGKPLTLHIDHISGKSWDNRMENLRFLCPNCHQQTETWGSRNSAFPKIASPKLPRKKRERKNSTPCKVCGNLTTRRATYCCQSCKYQGQQKTTLKNEELFARFQANDNNFLRTGRELGISDNAVRKRLKKAGLI